MKSSTIFLVFSLIVLISFQAHAQEPLQIEGAISIGDSKVDSTAAVGTVRYNPRTEDFEGFDGRKWVSFTKPNGGQWGIQPTDAFGPNNVLGPSDSTTGSNFGGAVAIGDNVAVVGSSSSDSMAMNAGAAYVFERSGSDWELVKILFPNDPAASDAFGTSVDISGNYIIVGSPNNDDNGDDSGSAYIFHRSGGTWMQQAKLIPPDGAAGDIFGYAVSISGNLAVVGAPSDKDNGTDTGSTYAFARSGTFWSAQAKLLSPNPDSLNYFGFSVNIDDDYVVVGAPGNDTFGVFTGAAYIFHRSGSNWIFQKRLFSPHMSAYDYFGYSVSISENSTVVSSVNSGYSGVFTSGSVQIFIRDSTAWLFEALLVAPNPDSTDYFGFSVAIYGDYLVVGEPYNTFNNVPQNGSAYVFHRTDGVWVRQTILSMPSQQENANFGASVYIHGENIIVGSPYLDAGGFINLGHAFIYKRN